MLLDPKMVDVGWGDGGEEGREGVEGCRVLTVMHDGHRIYGDC